MIGKRWHWACGDLPASRSAMEVALPGGHKRGGGPASSSVSDGNVEVMKTMLESGSTQAEIGAAYRLSQPHISLILTKGVGCWRLAVRGEGTRLILR